MPGHAYDLPTGPLDPLLTQLLPTEHPRVGVLRQPIALADGPQLRPTQVAEGKDSLLVGDRHLQVGPRQALVSAQDAAKRLEGRLCPRVREVHHVHRRPNSRPTPAIGQDRAQPGTVGSAEAKRRVGHHDRISERELTGEVDDRSCGRRDRHPEDAHHVVWRESGPAQLDADAVPTHAAAHSQRGCGWLWRQRRQLMQPGGGFVAACRLPSSCAKLGRQSQRVRRPRVVSGGMDQLPGSVDLVPQAQPATTAQLPADRGLVIPVPQGISPSEDAARARQILGHIDRIADRTSLRAALHRGWPQIFGIHKPAPRLIGLRRVGPRRGVRAAACRTAVARAQCAAVGMRVIGRTPLSLAIRSVRSRAKSRW
jgi:hypothetical protein